LKRGDVAERKVSAGNTGSTRTNLIGRIAEICSELGSLIVQRPISLSSPVVSEARKERIECRNFKKKKKKFNKLEWNFGTMA
jgi:hypothetical protein